MVPHVVLEFFSQGNIKRITLLMLFFWTLASTGFGILSYNLIQETVSVLAHSRAAEAFNKDQAFRLWATMHGGVYVPVSEKTPANEYLVGIPEREIITPSGKSLTLMNPAYMVRQMNEEFSGLFGAQGHITSLMPLRPENKADEWESAALKSFENGAREVSEVVTESGRSYLRLMRPMVTTEGCLKCHEHQGYQLGDIRGGVSVKVPLEHFINVYRGQEELVVFGVPILWIIGVSFILVSSWIMQRSYTEQRRKELEYRDQLIAARDEAEAANRSKSVFLSNMSHEIRTPVNGVMGMLQLLQMSPMSPEQEEYVEAAIESCRRLTRLLSDILDLSRVEAGKMNVFTEPFDFERCIGDIIQLFKPVAEQKGLRLQVRTNQEIPSHLEGDSVRVQQILSNLLGNAIKFSDKGRISVEVDLLPSVKNGRIHVLFSISDTGIGISDEEMEQLFVPFSQVEVSFQRRYQGAGLGLAISRRLIALLGGTMAFESEKGVGSTCYVCLPFKVADGDFISALSGKSKVNIGGLKVLVAEDDSVSGTVVSSYLKGNGCRVDVVEDGQSVLARLKEEKYDLVLMDVQMPVLDGVEATEAVRRGEAGLSNMDIPIIAMTAYAMAGDKEKFLEAGMNGYLSKPVEIEAMVEMMQGVLEKRKQPRSGMV